MISDYKKNRINIRNNSTIKSANIDYYAFFPNKFTVLIDDTPGDEDGENVKYKILYLFYLILFMHLIEDLVNNTTFIN